MTQAQNPGEVVFVLNVFRRKFRQLINSFCSSPQIFSVFPRFKIFMPSPTMGFTRNYFLWLIEAKFREYLPLLTLPASKRI